MAAIADIPGISLAQRDALAALGLHTTDDLLRTERHALVRRVPGLTLKDVLRWQSVAALVQVDGLPVTDAAALTDAGVGSLDELASWPPTRVQAALPQVDADTAAGWSVDAMRLTHTGVVNGNVRLRDGTPVEGAAVRVYGQSLTTDGRGRFRATRLPLDVALTIDVHHPDLGFRRVRRVSVVRAGALVATDVQLAGRRQNPSVLSELRGDALPPLGSAPLTTRVVDGGPDPHDVLVVISTDASGTYRAASRFLDFADGRFVRRIYRIAAARISAIPQRGDDLVTDGTGWRVTKLSSRQLGRRVERRAFAKRFPDPPQTAAEQDAVARALVKIVEARR